MITETMYKKMTYQEICDDLPIGKLKNTDDDTFWYADKRMTKRFKHEKARVGNVFYDGNNGDKWKVLATSTAWNRIIVENTSQGGMKLVYWDYINDDNQ